MTVPILAHHTAIEALAMLDELVDVHLDARVDLVNQAFYSAERFAERLRAYFSNGNGFDLVTAHVNRELVGYAFGSTLPANTRWWENIQEAEGPGLTREDGKRTFGFREILVRRAYQRRGYARRLHDELLTERPEERASLGVRADNPAMQLYLRWGWRRVGWLQPFADSPKFQVMVLHLGPGRARRSSSQ